MRALAISFLLGSMLALQGCVAALLPVIAVGAIGKTRVDAASRAKRAQAGMEEVLAKNTKPIVIVGPPEDRIAIFATPAEAFVAERPLARIPVPGISSPAPVAANKAAAVPEKAKRAVMAGSLDPNKSLLTMINPAPVQNGNPYSNFSRFVLDKALRRDEGFGVQSAVLVEKVSLALPETMRCNANPLAVIIDLDAAPGKVSAVEFPTLPLGDVLKEMRSAGVRLIWMSEREQSEIDASLDPLREGENTAIHADDLISLGEKKGMRKQQRRWELAKYYCIVAVAGDMNADFDELYDYLLKPEYAVSLNKFWNNGWFKLPHPISVAAPAIEESPFERPAAE